MNHGIPTYRSAEGPGQVLRVEAALPSPGTRTKTQVAWHRGVDTRSQGEELCASPVDHLLRGHLNLKILEVGYEAGDVEVN